ncbi:DUF5320 domain-containing protein [Clostridiisalibacter paucivorans]|uniref:DUF5320 domain-containing protein n=1 Tax=Clostridiisalibacter paucivorans TaxID=408753 RepID=UPI000550BDF2|nr:DUF5320 domain-containing protein [Clostridiisalibacter paucivorans]
MPRRDGTGPVGQGPMTGWGRGYCRTDAYDSRRIGCGRRFFGRRGFGAGIRSISSDEEKSFLEEEKGILKRSLEEVENRINQLNKDE